MFRGEDIVAIGEQHVGERYVLGAIAPLANPAWTGPWDCTEFASWCAYRACGVIFAVRPADPARGESYSGWWYDDAVAQGRTIDVAIALRTPGAVLVRRPQTVDGRQRIGHVAISRGDGESTVEAKDSATGVAIVAGAASRPWTIGVTLPGVLYNGPKATRATKAAYAPASGLLFLDDPYMRSPAVAAVQRSLALRGINPGGTDGLFGPLTQAAVRPSR